MTSAFFDVSLSEKLIGKSRFHQNKILYEEDTRAYSIRCEPNTPLEGMESCISETGRLLYV